MIPRGGIPRTLERRVSLTYITGGDQNPTPDESSLKGPRHQDTCRPAPSVNSGRENPRKNTPSDHKSSGASDPTAISQSLQLHKRGLGPSCLKPQAESSPDTSVRVRPPRAFFELNASVPPIPGTTNRIAIATGRDTSSAIDGSTSYLTKRGADIRAWMNPR